MRNLVTSFLRNESDAAAILRNESGATAIEYGLIAAGISVAIITIVGTVGSSLVAVFTSVSTALK
jgi:pilus assembly protein Flp/PilA